jgi:hypothetical protein
MGKYSPSLSVCYDLSAPVLSLGSLGYECRELSCGAVWTSSSAVTRAMSNTYVHGSA